MVVARLERIEFDRVPSCDVCRDRGWISFSGLTGEKKAVRCTCHGRISTADLVRRLEYAGMEPGGRDIASALEPWDEYPGGPAAPQRAIEWARRLAQGEHTEPWAWFFWGEPGRGKSKAAAMVMAEYLRAGGRNAVWINCAKDLQRIADENRDGVSPLQLRVIAAELLHIDDAGHEAGKHDGQVLRWIETRYLKACGTTASLNEAPSKVFPADWMVSRFEEARVVPVRGDDYRRIRAKREN